MVGDAELKNRPRPEPERCVKNPGAFVPGFSQVAIRPSRSIAVSFELAGFPIKTIAYGLGEEILGGLVGAHLG